MISAREAALLALNDIFYNGKYSNMAVKAGLEKCRGMNKVEKGLFTNLVYGVVSRHFTIEYVIKKYSSVKIKKLARYVRLILELGIYQIMFMDKIPERAAVDECVKLSKKFCKKGSDRFVNGVLRAVCNDKTNIEFPRDEKEYLSVKYSFSIDMTKMLLSQYGYEFTEKLMESLNLPPKILLRPNTLKTNANDLAEKLKQNGIDAVVLDNGMIESAGFDIADNEFYRKGYFSVQDSGAYNASIVLSPNPGETVIDMCAAPGGKSTHMAELMNNTGKIISCDIYEHKVKLIESNSKRLGITSINAMICDGTTTNEKFINSADKVLCDVPCSGWGIIRRKPDIKLSHTQLDELYDVQKAILANGAKYVKPGGTLVYSTCTINKLENEVVTNDFTDNNSDFVKTFEKTYYPQIDNTDGFYICRLEKK